MHLKRHNAPKNWPVKKKGTKYVAKPSSSLGKGVPLLVALRDMLKIAQNRKEVKKAIYEKNILVNRKNPRDEKNALVLFDTLSILPMKKHYRLELDSLGKMKLTEISEKESKEKISKVMGKKMLKGKKVQLNLYDGSNFLFAESCKVNDSVSIDFESRKVSACLPLKESSNVFVFAGKHAGKQGILMSINTEKKMADISLGSNGNISVLTKQIMVIK